MVELGIKAKPVVDPVWAAMRADAENWALEESALAGWLHTVVLDQAAFQDALAFLLSQ